MQAAIREARRTFPSFAAGFPNRKPNQAWAVKVRVQEGEFTEYIWIQVRSIDPEGPTIRGTVDVDVVNLSRVRYGDPMTVTLDDLADWAVYEDGRLVRGNVTKKVLDQVEAEGDR